LAFWEIYVENIFGSSMMFGRKIKIKNKFKKIF